jgi:hypothetical protein
MHEYARQLDGLASSMEEDVFSVPEAALLEGALVTIAEDSEIRSMFPAVDMLLRCYASTRDAGERDEREYRLLRLYLGLHSLGTGYTPDEAGKITEAHGIANLPGGMLPVVAASRLIGSESASADLGAGNGLQGLLLQKLMPHRRTLLVELSSRLLDTGRMLEQALGIDEGKVEWVCGDILDADLSDIDLVYMYRPAKPYREGKALYENIAQRLSAASAGISILSVADCLGPYLGSEFALMHKDGYMTYYRKGNG